LHAWDGHSSQPLGMYRNFLVTLAGKTVHVDIEVINAPLDYNVLLGYSYTYAMTAVVSAAFHKMCFPHEGNIVTIDQLTYYELASMNSPKSIILSVSNKHSSTPCTNVSPEVYKNSSLLGALPSPPHPISEPTSMSVFMLQASRATFKQSGTPDQQPAPQHPIVALPAEPFGPTPPGPPPFVGASLMFPPRTVPLGLNHLGAIPPGHYPVGQIPFLFPPPRVFFLYLSWLRWSFLT